MWQSLSQQLGPRGRLNDVRKGLKRQLKGEGRKPESHQKWGSLEFAGCGISEGTAMAEPGPIPEYRAEYRHRCTPGNLQVSADCLSIHTGQGDMGHSAGLVHCSAINPESIQRCSRGGWNLPKPE